MEGSTANDIRNRLIEELDSMDTMLNNMLKSYNECLHIYTDTMQMQIESESFLKPTELVTLHHKRKGESVEKV